MRDKINQIIQNLKKIDEEMANVSANDSARLTTLGKERKRLEPIVQAGEEWLKLTTELDSLIELEKSNDPAMLALAAEEKTRITARLPELELSLKRLLRPPDPKMDRDSIIEIRAGAGGDEAGLFVAELCRMYLKWAQSKGLKTEIYSSSPTGIGGIKEVIFGVSGTHAYGWFRFEQGVHRVQRVPKTEAQGRIHTSTVTVAVLLEPTEVEIKVDVKDLKIDTYRASGAGGQHVNKTESAIRITHIPTGVVVACQEERSQGQNRMRAMGLLRAKLQQTAEDKQVQEQRAMRRKQVGTGDRSEKIRTYNFPQDRITDHRINVNVHNIEGFLAGDMEELFSALQSKEDELFEKGDM